MSCELSEAKRRLVEKLGPSYGVYIQLLGRWFRGLITKEEFDRGAKQLIPDSFVVEHNKFWLAFFHHCASTETTTSAAFTAPALKGPASNHFQINGAIGGDRYRQNSLGLDNGLNYNQSSPGAESPIHSSSSSRLHCPSIVPFNHETKVRCLPNRVMFHMKTYVIAWETGLDSAHDHVSVYINLALQHFLKNIITELICTKTAYRLRENRFKYAFGVKPMNPYLNNSLKIYTSNLEYDPYQIESNKMNSSLVDTYAYNDSLFPSRLYEAQALYEYACSTTSSSIEQHSPSSKRMKLSEILQRLEKQQQPTPCINTSNNSSHNNNNAILPSNGIHEHNYVTVNNIRPSGDTCQALHNDNNRLGQILKFESNSFKNNDDQIDDGNDKSSNEQGVTDNTDVNSNDGRLTLYHLLITFLTNRTIIPSRSLYSINLERILTKLSN